MTFTGPSAHACDAMKQTFYRSVWSLRISSTRATPVDLWRNIALIPRLFFSQPGNVIRRLRHTIFIRTYAPNLGRLDHATTLCLQVIENDGGPGQSRTADLRFTK